MDQHHLATIQSAVDARMRGFPLAPGARVLVCVSGGADSVCLLRMLADAGVPLGVFHMDHGTRGDAGASDARFVRELTASMGLPFHHAARDVPAEAQGAGKSLEEAGRDARYEEALRVAVSEGYGAIATAHHADDQAETVLMRLIRGSGVKGLGGVPAIRMGKIPLNPPFPKGEEEEIPLGPPLTKGEEGAGRIHGEGGVESPPNTEGKPRGASVLASRGLEQSPPRPDTLPDEEGDPGRASVLASREVGHLPEHSPALSTPSESPGEIPIIRPLIDCTRDQIEAALAQLGQDFRSDASNADRAHHRNRVRHELLPLLREAYNPGVEGALVRLAAAARADDDLLDGLAQGFLRECTTPAGSIDRVAFAQGHVALQRRAAGLLLASRGVEAPFDRVEAVRAFIAAGAVGTAFEVEGFAVYNNREVTEWGDDAGPVLPAIPLAIPGETRIHGRVYRVRFRKTADIGDPRKYCTPCLQVFDADAFMGDAAVRGRQEGDRFRPLGLEGEKKLKDWFIDRGLTRNERAAQHLISVDDQIVWVVGHAIDARAAVTQATRRIVEIEVLE